MTEHPHVEAVKAAWAKHRRGVRCYATLGGETCDRCHGFRVALRTLRKAVADETTLAATR